MATRVPIDPDKGIDDLFKQLGDDSKRLVRDEIRLAKLEAGEAIHEAGRGALWLGLAFGVSIVALVAFTLFFTTAFGRIANGNYWVGAFLTALIEFALGLWLVQRGLKDLKKAPYSLPETRAALKLAKP